MTRSSIPAGYKAFDRGKAKAGAEMKTRDGRDVLSYTDSGLGIQYPIAALISGAVAWSTFTENGEVLAERNECQDLFLVAKKRTVWINLYVREQDPFLKGWAYDSQKIADKGSDPGRIGGRAYPIEIEA